MKFTSNFFIVDIKRGRATLARQIKAGKTYDVTLTGVLTTQHSGDDGVSIEFSGETTSLTLTERTS